MTKHTPQEIIAAVQAAGFKLIDMHGYSRNIETVDAVAIHTRGTRAQVVALYENEAYFSVNEVFLGADGLPRLSTCSVGGIIRPCGDIDYGVEQYNEGQKNNPLAPGHITHIVKRAA